MKPLDFGEDGVTGSVNAAGRLIALNFYHPQYGYVTLTSAAPFPESERYHPAAVRAYRASLAELDGFGVRFKEPITSQQTHLLESVVPDIYLEFSDDQNASIVTFAHARGGVQQIIASESLTLRWGGQFCLQRCAYTQLTEGGPLPMPPLRMEVSCRDGLLIIHNPELSAAVAIAGLNASGVEETSDQPLHLDFELVSEGRITLAYGVGLTVEAAVENALWLHQEAHWSKSIIRWQGLWQELPTDPLVRRGIAYGLMMAVPTGEGVCLLTDHMLLPLSWNRDAYFVARALLSAGQHEVVRRHLIWTFETAERSEGAWARCYLANGQVKDGAYQLDQQLYPLLELAEYVLETRDQDTLSRLRPHISATLTAIEARQSGDLPLFPTDETPADDPIALPYHLSSHILMWHMLRKLDAIGEAGHWAERISPLHDAVQQSFVADHMGRLLYAYAADGAGHFHFYHDANDFPLALAPAWGFVDAQDAVWQATIEFAFSEANVGAFYAGRLGSVHTRAAWTLGDVQQIVIARALGDPVREADAWAHLRAAAQPDGALSEAYDAATNEVVSRHWFAWPSAALACAELGAFGR